MARLAGAAIGTARAAEIQHPDLHSVPWTNNPAVWWGCCMLGWVLNDTQCLSIPEANRKGVDSILLISFHTPSLPAPPFTTSGLLH